MPNWKVWLNIQLSSPLSTTHTTNFQHIGKNIWYEGSKKEDILKETIWKTESITVIGNARIYNEASLWYMIGKTRNSTSTSTMEIIVELYKIYGFETALDYLDGDYAFVLMDYNIFGEEARLYVAKDAFGLFPLYKLEYPDITYKKVSFVPSEKNHVSEFVSTATISEMKASPLYIEIPSSPNGKPYANIYGFSSVNTSIEDASIESVPNGTYQVFTHSYKVSATWKTDGNARIIYQLPFQSTYHWKQSGFSPPNIQKRLEEQIRVAVQKRAEWITEYQGKDHASIGLLKLSMGATFPKGFLQPISLETFMNIPFLEIKLHLFSSFDNLEDLSKIESIHKIDSNVMGYLEEKYPSVLQEIKSKIDSNDPGIIRAHFIPAIVAKYIVEKYPEVKTIFMGEAFTYEYLEMNMFERRKWMQNVYFLEKVRAWTETFLSYGLDLYMPFLDRMLIQTQDNYSRV